jgi:hypothetical protein
MTIQEWLGVSGFVSSLFNAWKTWQRRPLVLLYPSDAGDEAIVIEIQNRSNRPITILRSRCWPSQPHQMWVYGRSLRSDVKRAVYGDIDQLMPPDSKQRFYFTQTKSGKTLLAIFFQSNAAIGFSKIPLPVFLSEARRERLRRSL